MFLVREDPWGLNHTGRGSVFLVREDPWGF